ncbi:MAG: hypothetical protein EOP10_05545 [Proteobacteria bacterium]|nr:MAG: hypothetical protein EOP10_05545 [Pseudomonadota bacterium]
MRRLKHSLHLLWAIALVPNLACRTQGDIKIDDPGRVPVSEPKLIEDPGAPVLQKVVGELTRDYPENRVEVCTLIESDLDETAKVKKEVAVVKAQELQDGFILRGVIPSIQYYGYVGAEQVLLWEISDEKNRTRIPQGELGNASLDYLMGILDAKCGVKDARP